MRKEMRVALLCGVWLAAGGPVTAAPVSPVTVSPGGHDRFVQVRGPCPSFSWAGVSGASRYELVVYEVGNREASKGTERGLGVEIMRQEIPGAASSWTLSLDRCLKPGGQYAWSVRASVGRADGEWSKPALFEVLSKPSLEDVRKALEVLEKYMAGQGADPGTADLMALLSQSTRNDAEPTPQDEEPEAVEAEPVPTQAPFSLLPALSAVLGEDSTATGAAFGLVGISHSSDGGYGVYGENVAKGNFGYLGGHDYGVLGRGKTGGGYFKDENQSGWAIVGFWNDGISAHGNAQGGFFQDDDSSGRAHVAWGNTGIEAWGNAIGGYFKDRETSPRAEAKLAYTEEGTASFIGVWARGNLVGGEFENSSGSGTGKLAAENTGLDGRGEIGVRGLADSAGGVGGFFNNPHDGTALHSGGRTRVGPTSDAATLLDVVGPGTAVGGVTSPEVVSRFRQSDTTRHSALSIDSADLGEEADPGQDAILYFSHGGQAHWGIRLDDTHDLLDIRHHADGGNRTAMRIGPFGAWTDHSVRVWGDVFPTVDDQAEFGMGSRRWIHISATNPIIQTSDARLKTDVAEIDYGLSEVLQLKPISYVWKKKPGGRTHLGFLAQEIEPLIPELVWRGDSPDSAWGTSPTGLVPVFVKAIQEQQRMIDRLDRVIGSLEEVSP